MSRQTIVVLLVVVGLGLLVTGIGFGLYPNPWGFDGHSRLTCGSAFFQDGYSPLHPECPARRARMLFLSVSSMVTGMGLVLGGWLWSRRL